MKVKDIVEGSGAVAEKGKVIVVQCDCRQSRGDLVFSSRNNNFPYQLKIGGEILIWVSSRALWECALAASGR